MFIYDELKLIEYITSICPECLFLYTGEVIGDVLYCFLIYF